MNTCEKVSMMYDVTKAAYMSTIAPKMILDLLYVWRIFDK
jgi:hypothetical protein